MESSHFLAVSSPCGTPLYKTFFLDFWFRLPNPQIFLPKIFTKSPITRLVWQIDRRCLHLPGVFGDDRFNGTMQNVLGPTLVAMATKFRLGAKIQSYTGLSCIVVSIGTGCALCRKTSKSFLCHFLVIVWNYHVTCLHVLSIYNHKTINTDVLKILKWHSFTLYVWFVLRIIVQTSTSRCTCCTKADEYVVNRPVPCPARPSPRQQQSSTRRSSLTLIHARSRRWIWLDLINIAVYRGGDNDNKKQQQQTTRRRKKQQQQQQEQQRRRQRLQEKKEEEEDDDDNNKENKNKNKNNYNNNKTATATTTTTTTTRTTATTTTTTTTTRKEEGGGGRRRQQQREQEQKQEQQQQQQRKTFLSDVDPRQSLTDISVELVLVDCHRVTRDKYIGRLVVSPFDGDQWGRPPADVADVRGQHAGVGGGERPAVGGNDRPVAVWHRLSAAWLPLCIDYPPTTMNIFRLNEYCSRQGRRQRPQQWQRQQRTTKKTNEQTTTTTTTTTMSWKML